MKRLTKVEREEALKKHAERVTRTAALLVPFIVDEVMTRAGQGNKTAKSILRVAEFRMKQRSFEQMMKHMMGGG